MAKLITRKDERLFKKMLGLSPEPEVTLTYHELLGFIYGIAITPDLIEPSEWIPIIFGDESPEYETEEQASLMMSALLSSLNRHIAAFQDGTLVLPFRLDEITDDEIEDIWEWTSGFDEALSLRPECWEDVGDLSDGEQEHLLNSLIVVEGIVFPEDAIDMFAHLPKADLLEMGMDMSVGEVEKAMQVQFFMLQALELAVETIQGHGMKLEKRRRKKLRASPHPFPVRSSKIGINEFCICGSGKKYKHCCGKVAGQQCLFPLDAEDKKEGKIIKVEFPQHGRQTVAVVEKISKKKEQKKGAAVIYQLEITLTYTDPAVWRVIQVPGDMTLADLHMIIQHCMGWQNAHMHQFQIGMKYYGPQMADDYADIAVLDESRFTLQEFEKDLLQGIVYTYDFGDNWEHVIMLRHVLPISEGKPYPLLVEGARACPPEDIGGAQMFEEFLEFLENPDDEEHQGMYDVDFSSEYDAEHVGKNEINKLLRKLYGKK